MFSHYNDVRDEAIWTAAPIYAIGDWGLMIAIGCTKMTSLARAYFKFHPGARFFRGQIDFLVREFENDEFNTLYK